MTKEKTYTVKISRDFIYEYEGKAANEDDAIQKAYDDYSSPYDIDPTPQYLYDDTGGEPPISAEERHRKAFEQKLRDKG